MPLGNTTMDRPEGTIPRKIAAFARLPKPNSGFPTRRSANPDGVQVDQEKSRPIVGFQPDEDVAGVQIIMQDAGLMNLSNEGAQCPSQTMPHRDQSIPLQSGQSLFDKGAQRLGT